jgi:hypothetical protein
VRLWALYKSISTTLGIIFQKLNGSKPPSIGLKVKLVVLVEDGFGDAMEQLKDVLKLLLFDIKAYCPLSHLE